MEYKEPTIQTLDSVLFGKQARCGASWALGGQIGCLTWGAVSCDPCGSGTNQSCGPVGSGEANGCSSGSDTSNPCPCGGWAY